MLNQLLQNLKTHQAKIAVIGLGYVGLPLAVEFAKHYRVIGFDIKQGRVDELRQGLDATREVEAAALQAVGDNLQLTSNPADLEAASVYIVTVPTPIDEYRRPDLRPLLAASKTVGQALKPGNVVIYESTVYPGCTEEDCVPILEAESGLAAAFEPDRRGRSPDLHADDPNVARGHIPDETAHRSDTPDVGRGHVPDEEVGRGYVPDEEVGRGYVPDAPGKAKGEPTPGNRNPETVNRFFAGYSPERINPGDKAHGVTTIVKVTSGSTPDCAEFVDQLYKSIITAGTYKAKNIRTAEAAKVIENTQRDVNIALVNELAMLFGRLGLDTTAVLEAAATKWNFLPFKPGLVGGHCIGVDPYYLTHKAQQIGFHPQMILAGRRTNDGMGHFAAGELIKHMAKKSCYHAGARVLVLGLTFKENCPDLRNTRVVDVIAALNDYNLAVDIHDPWADPAEAREEYGLELTNEPEPETYDAAILCVAHKEFEASTIRPWLKEKHVLYDLKSVLPPGAADARL